LKALFSKAFIFYRGKNRNSTNNIFKKPNYRSMMKNQFIIMVLASGLWFMCGCGSTDEEVTQTQNAQTAENSTGEKIEQIIDLKTISSKTLPEVETVLGKAERVEKVKGYPCEKSDCQKALFKNGQYEIIFKSDKSDRITINSVPNLTGNENAIQSLGLPASKPAFKNPNNVIRWNDIENISEISFFTDYILIQITKAE
jgi:hypothetical protein